MYKMGPSGPTETTIFSDNILYMKIYISFIISTIELSPCLIQVMPIQKLE